MAFTKAIEHKKEHRKIYRGSKAFDASCRNQWRMQLVPEKQNL